MTRWIAAVVGACTIAVAPSAACAQSSDELPDGWGYVNASDSTTGEQPQPLPDPTPTPVRLLGCTYEPVEVGRPTSSWLSGGYRYTYIDLTYFRVHLASGEVEVRAFKRCSYSNDTSTTSVVWWVDADPDPRVLIPGSVDEAIEKVFAPVPLLSPTQRGVVNLGMWLAVDNGDPVTARASASSSTWAETTASLRETTFDFGNGDSVTCAGAGDPIPESERDSVNQSPVCGYTYAEVPGSEPYRLTITSTWSVVSVTSGGETVVGDDLVLSTTIDYPVIEVQTVGVAG